VLHCSSSPCSACFRLSPRTCGLALASWSPSASSSTSGQSPRGLKTGQLSRLRCFNALRHLRRRQLVEGHHRPQELRPQPRHPGRKQRLSLPGLLPLLKPPRQFLRKQPPPLHVRPGRRRRMNPSKRSGLRPLRNPPIDCRLRPRPTAKVDGLHQARPSRLVAFGFQAAWSTSGRPYPRRMLRAIHV
jgi:hypothetical protein